MNFDCYLKDTLNQTLRHAVSRIEELEQAPDRRSVFNEQKEWLGPKINEDVWALPVLKNEKSSDN